MNNPEDMSKGMTPNLPLWSYQLQQNSKLAVKTRKDLEVHLITRALKDEGFKQELLANPKTLVEQELGTKLPEELEINVLEETEDTLLEMGLSSVHIQCTVFGVLEWLL